MGKNAWKVTDVFILRIRLSNIFYSPSPNVCQFASTDLNLITNGTDPFSHLIEILRTDVFLHERQIARHLLSVEFVS